MGAVQHLQQIIVVYVFLQLLSNGLELLKIENSILIDIVNCENTLASVLGLALSHLVADDVEEFVEADGSVGVPEGVDEREDEGVPLVHS